MLDFMIYQYVGIWNKHRKFHPLKSELLQLHCIWCVFTWRDCCIVSNIFRVESVCTVFQPRAWFSCVFSVLTWEYLAFNHLQILPLLAEVLLRMLISYRLLGLYVTMWNLDRPRWLWLCLLSWECGSEDLHPSKLLLQSVIVPPKLWMPGLVCEAQFGCKPQI